MIKLLKILFVVDHTIIYINNGDVLVFGNNTYGQLGLGYNNNM